MCLFSFLGSVIIGQTLISNSVNLLLPCTRYVDILHRIGSCLHNKNQFIEVKIMTAIISLILDMSCVLTVCVYMCVFSISSFHFWKEKWDSGLDGIFFFKISYSVFFILFFNFTILYWFCHISTWIRHRYTRVPHPEPSSLLKVTFC